MPDERWIITDELWDLVEPLIPKKQRRAAGGAALARSPLRGLRRCSACAGTVRPTSRRTLRGGIRPRCSHGGYAERPSASESSTSPSARRTSSTRTSIGSPSR